MSVKSSLHVAGAAFPGRIRSRRLACHRLDGSAGHPNSGPRCGAGGLHCAPRPARAAVKCGAAAPMAAMQSRRKIGNIAGSDATAQHASSSRGLQNPTSPRTGGAGEVLYVACIAQSAISERSPALKFARLTLACMRRVAATLHGEHRHARAQIVKQCTNESEWQCRHLIGHLCVHRS